MSATIIIFRNNFRFFSWLSNENWLWTQPCVVFSPPAQQHMLYMSFLLSWERRWNHSGTEVRSVSALGAQSRHLYFPLPALTHFTPASSTHAAGHRNSGPVRLLMFLFLRNFLGSEQLSSTTDSITNIPTFCPWIQYLDNKWRLIKKPWAFCLKIFQSRIGSNITLRLYNYISY